MANPFHVLNALQEKVKKCKACRNALTRKNTVFGSGSMRAKLAVLGEGPGEEEDRTGQPFVGPAGILLNRILETIRFTRDDVYVCNVVKCRACGEKYSGDKVLYGGRLMNRTPEQDEIDACKPFLRAQLGALHNLELVLCFGSVPGHWMLGYEMGELKMGGMRGRVFRSPMIGVKSKFLQDGVPTIITYHPSYLLRNPEMKMKSYADIKLVTSFFAGKIAQFHDPHAAESYMQWYGRKSDERPWGKTPHELSDPYTEKLEVLK